MITLFLRRYYGTPNITKSYATFEDDEGNVLMKCEAREGRFVDYDGTVKTPGSATFCLGRGEYRLVVDHCVGNAMCLRIYGDKRRMGFYIMVGSDEREQFMLKRVQLGRGTTSEPKYRRICDFAKTKQELYNLLHDNFIEEFRMIVSNENIIKEEE